MTLPTKFEDLGVEALRRTALEDFAVAIDPKDNKKMVIAALTECGVTWDAYLGMHPEHAPEVKEAAATTERAPEPSREGPVVTAKNPQNIRTAETPKYKPEDVMLIKMERENPVFEVKGYRFTSANPYALVKPADAERLLKNEVGFRQALPSELEEFYS